MITFVFIVCRLAELLQNFSRNPSRLLKAATTSYPRCGDVSGPVMASRFCSPYWWWKRHWLMQIVFVLWLLMREPIIEDNASDHALFCKYAAELLERVTGKSLATSSAVPSLSRINKVWTWNWHKLSSHTGEGGDLQQRLYSTVYCSLTFVWTANVRKSLISIIKVLLK